MGVAITNWFVAEGRQGGLMLRSVLAAALNIVLNFGLIPAFGARGAALATLVSLTFAYVFANALFPSTRLLFRLQMRALLPRRARPERP
jgi:PST family polysaccharide transporter